MIKGMNVRSIAGILVLSLALLCAGVGPAGATPTEGITVLLVDGENETILAEEYVDYRWMEANLPVYGDGTTHYYHQGPVFSEDPEVAWDRNETTNFKDHGAPKGTNVADLCDLVGSAAPGDEVMIHAGDGYNVVFPYENVYTPDPRQGPMVLCWYNGEEAEYGARQGVGYVPDDYYNGIHLLFFADTSTNAEGLHVYGNYDMYETMPGSAQHFYELSPSTNGFTVKWVDEVRIYRGGYTGDRTAPVSSLADEKAGDTGPVPTETPAPLAGIAGLFAACALMRRRA